MQALDEPHAADYGQSNVGLSSNMTAAAEYGGGAGRGVQFNEIVDFRELPPRSAMLRFSRLVNKQQREAPNTDSLPRSAFSSSAQPSKSALKGRSAMIELTAEAAGEEAAVAAASLLPAACGVDDGGLPEQDFPRMYDSPSKPTHGLSSGGQAGQQQAGAASGAAAGAGVPASTLSTALQQEILRQQEFARVEAAHGKAGRPAAGVAFAAMHGGADANTAALGGTAAKPAAPAPWQQQDGSSPSGSAGSTFSADGAVIIAAPAVSPALIGEIEASGELLASSQPQADTTTATDQQRPAQEQGTTGLRGLRERYQGGRPAGIHPGAAAALAAVLGTPPNSADVPGLTDKSSAPVEGAPEPGFSVLDFAADDPDEPENPSPRSSNAENQEKPAVTPPGDYRPLPPVGAQLTPRALLVGVTVGACLALLCQRLALTSGIIPTFQVAAAAGCWAILRGWTGLMGRDFSHWVKPLRVQETAVASAAALACAGSVAAGSFANALVALTPSVAKTVGNVGANNLGPVFSLPYWQALVWMLLVTLSGGMLAMAWRKALMSRRHITFPTGDATGTLLAALHVPPGSYHGRKQRTKFGFWALASGASSAYMWLFSRAGPNCAGFAKFPALGLAAARYTWNFDFSWPYVGVGLIAPGPVTWSMLVGAICSWAILWPLMNDRAGSWYPKGLPSWDVRGVFGYQITIGLALLAADALYHLAKLSASAAREHLDKWGCTQANCVDCDGEDMEEHRAAAADADDAVSQASSRTSSKRMTAAKLRAHGNAVLARLEADARSQSEASSVTFSLANIERELRRSVFLGDPTPAWFGLAAFGVLGLAAVIGLPALFSGGTPWYLLLTAVALAVLAAFANCSGAGMTDWSLVTSYGQMALALLAARAGQQQGTVTGLLAGGVVSGVSYGAMQAMYALRAGYVNYTSVTAVLAAQLIGGLAGCFIAPAALVMFGRQAGPLGVGAAASAFPAPQAAYWRSNAAVVAQLGLSALPDNAAWMSIAAAVAALALNVVRDLVSPQTRAVVPLPAAMGITFISGANVAVDLTVGSLVRVVWQWRYARSCNAYAAVVGGALIAGDGLWAVGRGILASFNVQPPMCMSFT